MKTIPPNRLRKRGGTRPHRHRRPLRFESLEARQMLSVAGVPVVDELATIDEMAFYNQIDVDNDGSLRPRDALVVLNHLNRVGVTNVAVGESGDASSAGQSAAFDVNRDQRVTPVDVLLLVNELGRNGGSRILPRYVPTPELDTAGVLTINGTVDNDEVRVQLDGDELLLHVANSIAARTHCYDRADVTELVFEGFDGDDTFRNETTLPSNQNEPRGISAELIRGVLSVRGTGEDDHIDILGGAGSLKVFDGGELVGSFNVGRVRAIQVVAGAGQDVVNLATDSENTVHVGAWIYGGPGNDTLHGGGANDYLFGGEGDDVLYGHEGDDVLYGDAGGADELHGGGGADHLSLSPRTTMESVPAGDHDIESLSYEDREYFDLLNRHRDAWGFVVNHGSDGGPEDINDAGIFTGIALAETALRGDNEATLSLLETLRDQPWVVQDGKIALARHPNSFDYVQEGDQFIRDGNQPMTKDGIVGIVTGVYYAYQAGGMSADTRAVAREVMSTYLDYLIINKWNTIDHYPDHYWAQTDHPSGGKKAFANVFSSDGGAVMWKGPDSYMLSPTDMYAVQNAASEMGFTTSGWQPWANFQNTIVQVLGDGLNLAIRAAADSLASWVGAQVDSLLQQIKLDHDFSFHVIPGVDWTLISGNLRLEISQADRQNIVSMAEEAVRGVLYPLAAVVDAVSEVPALMSQLNGLSGRIADEIIDALPDWAAADRWKPAIDNMLQQVMPWLNGNALGELVAFNLAFQMAKSDEILSHLTFWPTLLMYETRPEMVDLLGPSVADLHGALNGKMDMLLFAWLDRDTGQVEEWLNRFESDPSCDNLAYAWKKPKSENAELLAQDPSLNPGHHRLDYLILKQLDRRGVPESLSESVGDWLKHMGDELQRIGDQIKRVWDDLRDNIAEFAKSLWNEFHPALSSLAGALWSVTQDLPEIANALWSVTHDLPGIAEALYNGITHNLTNIAGALWDGITHNLANIADALWAIGPATLKDIANALWSSKIDPALYQVANALYSGITHNLSSIANALWSGVTHNLASIADALWTNTISPRLADVADALWTATINPDLFEVANALWSGITHNLHSIANALWTGITHNLANIVGALWTTTINPSLADVADALWTTTINPDLFEVANALWSGITHNLRSIADALWDGITHNLGSIAGALWTTTINPSITGVADALWNGIRESSFNGVVSGLMSGLGLNYSYALWIVNLL